MASYTAFIPDFSQNTLREMLGPSLRFTATVSPLLLDTIPPLVQLVSPAALTQLQRTDPITIDVMDSSLGFHVIFAYYPDVYGLHEVVFGGVWPSNNVYTEGAFNVSRQVITSPEAGFRYTFSRKGGWPGRPIIQVRATDLGSGEVL